MRIAFVRLPATSLVWPDVPGVFGGAEVRAWTFARELARRGTHEVEFVVAPPEMPVERTATEPPRLRTLSFPGHAIGQGPARVARKLVRSVQRRVTGQPTAWPELQRLDADVFCTFGLHDPTAAVVRAARRSGRLSVVFLTSDEETSRAVTPSTVAERQRRQYAYALEHADLFVAQTQRQWEWIRKVDRPAVLIRNPIDVRLDADACIPLPQRRYILWVGRAEADVKRADLLLELARRCPQVPFVAVMNAPANETLDRWRCQAPANLRMIEHVDWEASDAVYRHALALVNTSESEGFPNAFLQAAKFGVPIVSRRVNPDDVLTRHRLGFVARDNLESLAKMVQRIAAEPDRFCFVSASARRYVQRYHALPARVAELEAAFRGLRRRDTKRGSLAA